MKYEKIEIYLSTVTSEMTFGEARTGTKRELQSHIEEHIQVAKSYGKSETESVDEALRRMGNAKDLGVSLNKIHQPKLDLVLPIAALGLSGIGLWNLSGGVWMNLQVTWVMLGFAILATLYLLPIDKFKNFVSSLYSVAIVGLISAYYSGVVADGQPYLSIAGLNIKMVDLAGTLFALGLPALGSKFKNPFALIALFLLPMIYFSLNGFIWPGLLFFVSGLCYLGSRKISTLSFVVVGLIASGLLASRFADGLVAINEVNKAIIDNAHTDFAFRSLSVVMGLEILAGALFVIIVTYGTRLAFAVKDSSLRAMAIVAICLMTVQIFTSVLANVGLFPMVSAGTNVPFVSYGGSGIIASFLVIGTVIGCWKRGSILVE